MGPSYSPLPIMHCLLFLVYFSLLSGHYVYVTLFQSLFLFMTTQFMNHKFHGLKCPFYKWMKAYINISRISPWHGGSAFEIGAPTFCCARSFIIALHFPQNTDYHNESWFVQNCQFHIFCRCSFFTFLFCFHRMFVFFRHNHLCLIPFSNTIAIIYTSKTEVEFDIIV